MKKVEVHLRSDRSRLSGCGALQRSRRKPEHVLRLEAQVRRFGGRRPQAASPRDFALTVTKFECRFSALRTTQPPDIDRPKALRPAAIQTEMAKCCLAPKQEHEARNDCP